MITICHVHKKWGSIACQLAIKMRYYNQHIIKFDLRDAHAFVGERDKDINSLNQN